jgi:hypothetical protein
MRIGNDHNVADLERENREDTQIRLACLSFSFSFFLLKDPVILTITSRSKMAKMAI